MKKAIIVKYALTICISVLVISLCVSTVSSYDFEINSLYDGNAYDYSSSMAVDDLNDPRFIFYHGTYAFIKDSNWHYEKIIDLKTMENPINTQTYNLFRCAELSVDLDSKGNPHVLYRDVRTEKLVYTKRIDGVWDSINFELIRDHFESKKNSIKIDNLDRPHIVTIDNCTLRHRFFDGLQWQEHSIILYGNCSARFAFALNKNGRPNIIYNNYDDNITHVYHDGITWQENIFYCDSLPLFPDFDLGFDENNHMYYAVGGHNYGLVYRHFNGEQWQTDEIEPEGTYDVKNIKLISKSNEIHLVYRLTENSSSDSFLRHKYYTDTWYTEDIDENPSKIFSFEIDNSGRFHICYTGHVTVQYAISISENDVNPMFSVANQQGQVPLTVQFTDLSTGPITQWLWDFGDGITSAERHPEHVYRKPGHYDVRLLISGPKDSKSYMIKNGVWAQKDISSSLHNYIYVAGLSWPGYSTPGKLYVIDCNTKDIVLRHTNWGEIFEDVAVTKDGRSIFVLSTKTGDVIEVDRDTFDYKTRFHCASQISSLSLSNDDVYVFVSDKAGNIFRYKRTDATLDKFPMTDGNWEFGGGIKMKMISPTDENPFFVDTCCYQSTASSPSYTGYIAKYQNIKSNKPLLTPMSYSDNEGLGAICLSPNGRHLFTGKSITSMDTYTQLTKFNYQHLLMYSNSISQEAYKFQRDDKVFLHSSYGNILIPWRLKLTPDGKWLYALLYGATTQPLAIFDADTMQLVKGLPIGYEPRGIEFTPDGNFAYVISVKSPNSLPTGVVSIIDVQSKEIIKEIYLETNIKPFGIAIGPGSCGGDIDNDGDVDGTDLFIIAQGENNISVQYFAGDFPRIGCD